MHDWVDLFHSNTEFFKADFFEEKIIHQIFQVPTKMEESSPMEAVCMAYVGESDRHRKALQGTVPPLQLAETFGESFCQKVDSLVLEAICIVR